ncbi:F-box/LRR-repeat protein 20 [Camellia lanceoleosa]|uniref:F-box/LRR-repeat protein 20 n=1 Tax=Camellia lanceoleosa TaxID=1840588 RepID=A0ACC0FEH3_9ERIC|nr:F-box/LRR-repeat protein 20 [Camellia lanceoleosa]
MEAELFEDCWELILNRLAADDINFLQSPCLVSKQFLSITNRLRHKLVASNRLFYSNNCEALFRALQRFTNLHEIELHDPVFDDNADVNYPIRRIASSGLDLHSLSLESLQKPPLPKTFMKLGLIMKNLKILRCPRAKCFRNHHLVAIADALPWLEELGIQFSGNKFDSKTAKYMVTDAGIEVMSRKLRRLRKIDISGQVGCSDRSLIALSSNCELLVEIQCSSCKVTEHGVCFVLRHSRNLISLDAGPYSSLQNDSFTFENSMTYATSLRDLVLEPYGDHDRILSSISTAGIPLEKILIYEDSGLSLHGLSTFLCACPSLTHLTLFDIGFLNDDSMRDLCQYLSSLVYIKLCCSTLTATTFFLLTKECPMLSEIDLGLLELQVEDDLDMVLERNYRIRSLNLGFCESNDEFLKKIGVICPNLQTLNLTGLHGLTTESIGEILRCCSQIKHLTVDRTREMVTFLEQFQTRHIKIEHYRILEEGND